MILFPSPIAFLWDKGNQDKNALEHHVTAEECEEVFFDHHKKIFSDHIHSLHEERFRILGKTKNGRLLFVVFTIRSQKIRVISARDINRKEVSLYEEKIGSPNIQK